MGVIFRTSAFFYLACLALPAASHGFLLVGTSKKLRVGSEPLNKHLYVHFSTLFLMRVQVRTEGVSSASMLSVSSFAMRISLQKISKARNFSFVSSSCRSSSVTQFMRFFNLLLVVSYFMQFFNTCSGESSSPHVHKSDSLMLNLFRKLWKFSWPVMN